MKKAVLLYIFLTAFPAVAQKAEKETKLDGSTERIVKDSIISEVEKQIINTDTTSLALKNLDSVALKDHPEAALIDSLWKAELLNSDLFEEMTSILQENHTSEVVKNIHTDTLKARLAQLNSKTPINLEYNPVLEKFIHTYLSRNKKAMERLMALSTYYFPMFEQELDKHNIPLEIKYLAIVESALNPRARSRAGATGLWQFMYPTGKMHGLHVSSYVDERMDPIKSTQAACEYLARLYKVFGDWDLVLAAYNSGPGNVSKAIRRSGGKQNYWNLRPFLPRETAGYVPAFLATFYLFEYAKEHGFNPETPNPSYFETDTVHLKQMLTFDQISEVTGVDKQLIQFLNPSFKLDIIPKIERENYYIRLPKEQIGLFVSNEDQIYQFAEKELEKEELPQYLEADSQIKYRVRKGDYLGKIAVKYGVSISNIRKWNALKNNNLRIGQSLIIYPRKLDAVVQNTSEKIDSKVYIVKEGDSLWSISRKFPGITVKNIQKWNDISGSNLKPGMKLKLNNG